MLEFGGPKAASEVWRFGAYRAAFPGGTALKMPAKAVVKRSKQNVRGPLAAQVVMENSAAKMTALRHRCTEGVTWRRDGGGHRSP